MRYTYFNKFISQASAVVVLSKLPPTTEIARLHSRHTFHQEKACRRNPSNHRTGDGS